MLHEKYRAGHSYNTVRYGLIYVIDVDIISPDPERSMVTFRSAKTGIITTAPNTCLNQEE